MSIETIFFLNTSIQIFLLLGLINQLPESYRGSFNYLAQYGAFFLVVQFLARRGRENLHALKKADFELQQDEDGNEFFVKVTGELTKNHRNDSENIDELGGILPFMETPEGLNPGLYFKEYLKKLNGKNDHLFQRPARPSKKFQLHMNPDCW